MVAIVKQKTLADKLCSVEGKLLGGTLAKTLAETEMQTFGKTVAYLQTKALVDTLRERN